MKHKEFIPCELLKPYVNCYFITETHALTAQAHIVYPTGCIEVMFNLGSGEWKMPEGDRLVRTPAIELVGQVTSPLSFSNIGKNITLGVRFFPHTASLFFKEDICIFNNKLLDLQAVFGSNLSDLRSKLLEHTDAKTRIHILENFLIAKLTLSDKKLSKVKLVGRVINELNSEEFFDNIENVASRHGITSRYLQKLFVQHTGISPKLYFKINRFQHSLKMMTSRNRSYTAIAHECGYFDQSHFIKEFKSFTGVTPSDFS